MRLGLGRWLLCGTGALAAPLAACGGGGGSDGGAVGTALVKGLIVTRDGSTENLGGIVVTDARTGATSVSSPTGAFDLGEVPAGTLTLRVGSGVAAILPLREDEPGDDRGDDADDDLSDDGDDRDVGDDDFDVSDVSDGEHVEVRLHLDGGVIESCDVSRSSGEDDELEAESRLSRAASSDDPDTTGEMRVESRSDREAIRVEAEHLATGRVVEWFVIAPDVTEESQGTRTVDADGEAEWDLATNEGDRLPFDVTGVAELEGYGVEVRDATTGLVLLFGTIRALPPLADDDDSSGPGDDDDDGDEDEARGRTRLVREAGVSGEASVEVGSEGDDGEKIEFEIEGQAAPATVRVLLEDPANLGTMVEIGTLDVGDTGAAELELETDDGDALPFGVATVSVLVGLRVELRDATTDALLFSGAVPALVPED